MKAMKINNATFSLSWLSPNGQCSHEGEDCNKAQQIIKDFHEKILQVRDDFYQIESLLFQRNHILEQLNCPEINNQLG